MLTVAGERPRRRRGGAGAARRGLHARLRDPRDRRLAGGWADAPSGPVVYLHGVGDPGNVGTVIRTAQALVGGSVVLGPGCADPFSPKAVRASMGAIFAQPLAAGRGRGDAGAARRARRPRWRLLGGLGGAATLCLGAEREGLPAEVLERCEARADDPAARAAPSRSTWPRRRRSPASGYRRRHAGGEQRCLTDRGAATRGRGRDRRRARQRRAGAAAGPLPRPQGGADDDPARDRRAAAG